MSPSNPARCRTKSTPAIALALAAALCGCGGGGGGGGAPVRIPPRFLLASPHVDAGNTSASLELALEAPQESPVLVQLDVVSGSPDVTFRTAVQAIQALERVEAELVAADRLRIVIGDARHRDAPAIPAGRVLRIPLAITAGAGPGAIPLRVENIVASRADGAAIAVDTAPVTGTLTID